MKRRTTLCCAGPRYIGIFWRPGQTCLTGPDEMGTTTNFAIRLSVTPRLGAVTTGASYLRSAFQVWRSMALDCGRPPLDLELGQNRFDAVTHCLTVSPKTCCTVTTHCSSASNSSGGSFRKHASTWILVIKFRRGIFEGDDPLRRVSFLQRPGEISRARQGEVDYEEIDFWILQFL